jgi:hypothetical protein
MYIHNIWLKFIVFFKGREIFNFSEVDSEKEEVFHDTKFHEKIFTEVRMRFNCTNSSRYYGELTNLDSIVQIRAFIKLFNQSVL